MSIHRIATRRTSIATAFVVAVLAAGTSCGTEVATPSQDIGGGDRAAPEAPEVTAPPIDDRPCAPSIKVALREHRTVCAM